MDSRQEVFIAVNKCWVQALGVKDRIFKDCICVKIIDPPLGSNKLIGLVAIVFCDEFILV